jgi:hypothetical protein
VGNVFRSFGLLCCCDYCRRIGRKTVEMQEGRGGFDGRRALERLVARYPVLKSDEAVASVLAHEGRGIEESRFIEVAQELLLLRSQVGNWLFSTSVAASA